MARFSLTTPIVLAVLLFSGLTSASTMKWTELSELPAPPGAERHLGVAGPFVGIHNDALIVAGGANFPEPVWETSREVHDDVYVLVREAPGGERSFRWVSGFRLERPIAYGASVSTSLGVVCVGGGDGERAYADAFYCAGIRKTRALNPPRFLPFRNLVFMGERRQWGTLSM